jgi:DNA-binding transcriptional LysR family regulator
MYPTFEVRHLTAVITLAESLNYTRAAERLHITQSGFSKQIGEVEEQLGFSLFVRDGKKVSDLTEAGRIFVEHARLSLLHNQRAIQLAHSAHEGAERFLHVGYSPCVNRAWISSVLGLRLPLFPRLRIRISSDFVPELTGNVLICAYDLAIVIAPPPDEQLTSVPFTRSHLYAAIPETHPGAGREKLKLQDLAHDCWITFQPRVSPVVHHAIFAVARDLAIQPKEVHDFLTPSEALESVAEHVGVALLPFPSAPNLITPRGVVLRPLFDERLSFDTCLILRADNDSRMTNEFARTFLRKLRSFPQGPEQLKLPIAS